MYFKQVIFFTIEKQNKNKDLTKFSAVESAYQDIVKKIQST